MSQRLSRADDRPTASKLVKLVVWDLDNTLWKGSLLEGDKVQIREDSHALIKLLDSRGILHSIASKNDQDLAMETLKQSGLEEYFLYPHINWSTKSSNIASIANLVNVGLDAVAFIDDEPHEREEVKQALPQVMIVDAQDITTLTLQPEFIPRVVTEDGAHRREMYRAAMRRTLAQKDFVGANEEFLASLGLEYTIGSLHKEDLERAEELTVRTHQLNTTGYIYSIDQLNAFRESDDHLFFVLSLKDKFGNYGKIGLTLIEKSREVWTIKLFLVSCRVMSLGAGTVMINHLLRLVQQAGVGLEAEFLANQRNRMMLLTLRGAGFREVRRSNNFILCRHDPRSAVSKEWLKYTTSAWLSVQRHPEWLKVYVAP